MTKKQQYRKERIERLTKAHAIVSKGTCPDCGTKLYSNSALTGWFQCGHVGAAGFQKEQGPHCDFQIFYDPTPEEHNTVLAMVGVCKT